MAVSKSYVNGKFVRAVDLTAKQTKKIRTTGTKAAEFRRLLDGGPRSALDDKGQFGLSRGANGNRKDKTLQKFPEANASGKGIVAAMTGGNDDALTDLAASQNWGAFTLRTGGKNTGQSHIFHNPNARDTFMGQKMGDRHVAHAVPHEQAHADARRSQYRMFQVQSSTAKQGREEGRADFLASGHYKGKAYKADKYGQRVTGYAMRAHASDDPAVREVWRASSSPKKVRRAYAEYGLGTPTKEQAKASVNQVRDEIKWTNGYKDTHDRMRSAGTKVRKSMSNPFYRDDQGRFVSATRPKVTELFPAMLGHGFEQTEEKVDEVEKADRRPQRDESKGELPYRRRDAVEGLVASSALAPLAAHQSRSAARDAKLIGTGSKFIRAHSIGMGALAAGAGAAGIGFGRDLKRGGTKKHRFSDPVKKAAPDMADVHIQGVLRPLGRVKKRA